MYNIIKKNIYYIKIVRVSTNYKKKYVHRHGGLLDFEGIYPISTTTTAYNSRVSNTRVLYTCRIMKQALSYAYHRQRIVSGEKDINELCPIN